MHPRCCRPVASWVHYTTSCNTQSSVPEDGKNNFPKHVELTGIINKPLLLHLVGCLYCLYQWCTVKQISDNEIYLLIKYIKIVLWKVAKRLSYIEDARCLKVSNWIRWSELHGMDNYKNKFALSEFLIWGFKNFGGAGGGRLHCGFGFVFILLKIGNNVLH